MNKVLTIMPVYNTEEYLEGAIESVLQQQDVDTHLCIVNDKSTDNSLDVISKYKDKSNVTVLENTENRGCYYSRNRGLEWASKNIKFDYFTVHDSDDVSDVRRFKKVIKYLNNNQNVLGCTTTYVRVDYESQKVSMLDNNKPNIYASEGIAFYRKTVFDRIGYYDNTRFSGDTDYINRIKEWIKLNEPNCSIGQHNEVLYIAYLHETNLSVKYNFTHDRPVYWRKSLQEIEQMKRVNNFFRNIFK